MNITLHYLIKIGKKEHIDDLQKNGTIYMNPVSYFNSIEDNGLRGDTDEGITRIQQLGYLTLFDNGKELPIHDINEKFSAQWKTREPEFAGNIYSLYSISSEDSSSEDFQNFSVHERNCEFGDCCLIIYNTKEFITRVKEKVSELDYKLDCDLVKYYDDQTYSGNLGIYHKPIKYNYQNEFRLFVKRVENSVLSFKIGSIEDISTAFKSNKLKSLKIRLDTAPNRVGKSRN